MGLRSGSSIATSPRAWVLPAVLAALAIFAQVTGQTSLWRYDRAALADGEIWRLLTGHLVHLGWPHLGLNLAGLGLVWLLVATALTPLEWLFAVFLAVGVMDAGFWFLVPQLAWYVGLSGLLHGLLAAGLVVGGTATPDRRFEAVFLGAAVVLKLAWETAVGPLPGSESLSGGPVVVAAHLYGAIGGTLAGVVILLVRRDRRVH